MKNLLNNIFYLLKYIKSKFFILFIYINAFVFFFRNFNNVNFILYKKNYSEIKKSFNFKIEQKSIFEKFNINNFVTLKNVYVNGYQYIVSDLKYLYPRKKIKNINPLQYENKIPIFCYITRNSFGYNFLGRGRNNYGHNIMDVYFAIYLKEKLKINGEIIFFGNLNKADKFFINVLGISSKITILPKRLYSFQAHNYTFIPTLYFHSRYFEKHLLEYFNIIKTNALKNSKKILDVKFTKLFAIRRGYSRQSKIEEIVENYFRNKGYNLINFDHYSIYDQINIVQNTKILAGIHGSNLINGGFMNKGTIVEIITHHGHDSGEFKYFGAIDGNNFVSLDLRDELFKQLDKKNIYTKLKKIFKDHNL